MEKYLGIFIHLSSITQTQYNLTVIRIYHKDIPNEHIIKTYKTVQENAKMYFKLFLINNYMSGISMMQSIL